MTSSVEIKFAPTQTPVLELIRRRWSARSFLDKSIAENDLNTILEAASWAPSANNEQPWLYFAAHKGTPAFDIVVEILAGGNQPWAKNAAVLVVTVAKLTFEANQNNNPTALHDVGLANATLLLQATALGIFAHPMGGFDAEKMSAFLHLPATQKPVVVIAMGYLDEAEKLVEPFKTRELTPRVRKPLASFVTKL